MVIIYLTLGVLDGFFSLGRFIGSGILVLYKVNSLKGVYTGQAIIQTIISGIIFAIIFIVPVSLVQVLLIIAILVTGFSRSFVTVPRIIILNFSNPTENQFALAFWTKTVPLGDILTLIIAKQLL